MAVSQSTRAKWRQAAIDNQKAVHDMIHEIGMSYRVNPEKIAELLEFGSRFYKYSINNVKLIYTQNRGATYVQPFEKWKEMGASVMKGQCGIKIRVPVMSTSLLLPDGQVVSLCDATKEQKELYKKGVLEGKQTLHYKIGNVFDISQTNFPKENYPQLYSMGYDSEQHAAITDGLCKFCSERGVQVSFEDISSIALRGYYNPTDNRIVVNELLNDTQRLSTLSHEIGHALAQHGVREISTAQEEFEADSISILLQSHFGIELTESRKEHLAGHYRKFMDEIRTANPEIDEEGLIKKVDEALQASMEVFRNNIDQINQFVEEQVNRDKIADLGGTGLNENTPEGYTEACRNLLREVAPEDYKSFETSMEQCEQFRKDLINNGFQPTDNLMGNYIGLLEEKEKGRISETTLSYISEKFRAGSDDKIINDIGDELMKQELRQMQTEAMEAEACP